MSRKTYHQVHIESNIHPKALDEHYAGKHAAHEHAPMQPHELDNHDEIVPTGSIRNVADPAVDSRPEGHDDPYEHGNE